MELGIDAGNTQCMVSVVDSFGLRVVKATPSVVYIDSDRFYVGDQALRMGPRNPKNFIYDIQLMLGRSTKDDVIAKRREGWPFTTVDSHDGICVVVKDKSGRENRYPAWDLWSRVLEAAVKSAEEELGLICKDVVMSYPPDWNDDPRVKSAIEMDVKRATEGAGLRVSKYMDECTAAAQAYLFLTMLVDRMSPANNVMIFDLSATKLQMSWLTLKGYQYCEQHHQTIRNIGGRNFDDVLVHFVGKFFQDDLRRHGAKSDDRMMFRLRQACEVAKIGLSTASHMEINVETPFNTFVHQLTRKSFDKEAKNIVTSCSNTFNQFVRETRQRDFVILCVGGASNIPSLQNKLEKQFSGKIYRGFNVQEAVCRGLLADCKAVEPLPTMSGHIGEKPSYRFVIRYHNGNEKEIVRFDAQKLDKTILTVTFRPGKSLQLIWETKWHKIITSSTITIPTPTASRPAASVSSTNPKKIKTYK